MLERVKSVAVTSWEWVKDQWQKVVTWWYPEEAPPSQETPPMNPPDAAPIVNEAPPEPVTFSTAAFTFAEPDPDLTPELLVEEPLVAPAEDLTPTTRSEPVTAFLEPLAPLAPEKPIETPIRLIKGIDLTRGGIALTMDDAAKVVISSFDLMVMDDERADEKAFERNVSQRLGGANLDRNYWIRKASGGEVHLISKHKGLPRPTEAEWLSVQQGGG